jgi:hypothetical protein
MIPVVKGWCTETATELCSTAVQVFGGMGYIEETGIAQQYRDVKIASIYEGTTGIQALDLVGRKLPANMGRALRPFFHPIAKFIEDHSTHTELAPLVQGLARAFGALQLATAFIAQKGLSDAEEAGAAASDYLRLLGMVPPAAALMYTIKSGKGSMMGLAESAF